jgi:hypothetical protein
LEDRVVRTMEDLMIRNLRRIVLVITLHPISNLVIQMTYQIHQTRKMMSSGVCITLRCT